MHREIFKGKVYDGEAWCSSCRAWLKVDAFSTNIARKSKLHQTCKVCQGEYMTKMRDDGYYSVYELQGGHIGQTRQLKKRMINHKSTGKDPFYRILEITECADEALELEAYYQHLSPNYDKADNAIALSRFEENYGIIINKNT